MHGIWKAIGSFVRQADMVLLSLCIAASVFGIVVISSATNVKGSAQFVRTQTLALILGVILYVVFTLIDVDIIAERRELLLIFSAIFILLLFPSATPEAATAPGWTSASCRFPSSRRRSARSRSS